MNITDLIDEQKRVKIAEACRWKAIYDSRKYGLDFNGFPPDYVGSLNDNNGRKILPDYLNDLNAMREAKKTLTREELKTFAIILIQIVRPNDWNIANTTDVFTDAIDASARQCADAFGVTKNLWTI